MAERLRISRRDFLNGVALGVTAGTSLSPLELLARDAPGAGYYPPGLVGLRGSHPGSFEVAHAVAHHGATFDKPVVQTDDTYDLVVVGGGISGLAAAFLFQQQHGGGRRVLVLDNHDDFGGHAKRNEFNVDGKRLIGYGGSQSLESPGQYSPQSAQLLRDVGIDVSRFYDYYDRGWLRRMGLRPAIYFSREAYGRDLTVPNIMGDYTRGPDRAAAAANLAQYPISAESRASLAKLLQNEQDYLAGMEHDQKISYLRGISYTEFLRKHAGVTEEVATIMRDQFLGYWGYGFDIVSALQAWYMEQPGTEALGLDLDGDTLWTSDEPYIFHFPDGNAGVARAIVRQLVPDALPGASIADLVSGKVDYAVLDRRDNATRVRLNSTAVEVRQTPDQSHVDVTYVRDGAAEFVRGRHVIMACYNRVIPYIVPEVPEPQREAIRFAEKTPLAYISIAVRNWRAFAELGCNNIYAPQPALMYSFGLDFPVSIGDYDFTSRPDEPTVLHGTVAPTTPDQGYDHKEQCKLGQKRLLSMSFDDFETRIVRQLDGALGSAGFDVEREIAAITVNRWPHGYAYEYNDLFDPPDWGPGNGPHITGRARIGRISIANSDASAYSYVDGAIDAACRAVNEQIKL